MYSQKCQIKIIKYPIMSSNNGQSAAKKFNFCNTKLKTTSEKFIWAIDNFSERQEKCKEYFRSSEFISTAPNGQVLKWQMEMFPNGNKEEHRDYVSIFLYLLDSNNEEVKANYQISLRNSDSDEFHMKFTSDHIKFGNSGVDNWGVFKLIKREDLFSKENGYLSGDRLTILCKLVVQQESVKKAHIEVPESRVVEDLSNLFEKSLYTDCKIISEDDKEYKVHKCILGCRSPVFGAMFEHDMIEKNNNEINIDDMKGVVIEQMLRFIYSGKEPDLLEEMAEDLLIGADKYELPRLKLLCERKLIISLGTANACRLLLLANLYLAENLKNHAIDFIKMNVNEVKKSDGWKELLADEQLVEQILTAK